MLNNFGGTRHLEGTVALFSLHRPKDLDVLLVHSLGKLTFREVKLSRLGGGKSRTLEKCATPRLFILHGEQGFPFQSTTKDDLIMSKDGVILAHLVTCLVCKYVVWGTISPCK